MRSDRDEFGGGIMFYARKGTIYNSVSELEAPSLEALWYELIVSKKKWKVYDSFRFVSDVYSLSNLVTTNTCFTKNSSSSIDVFLPNWLRCSQNTSVFETGISDYHGLVISVMKSHLHILKPKIIKYHSYKSLMQKNFLSDVKLANCGALDDPDQADDNLFCTCRELL